MPIIYSASKKKEKSVTKKRMVKQKPNPLSAFMARPKGIRFETQEKKEKIILLLRRHWLTNIPWLVRAFLMLPAPLLLRFFPLLDFFPFRFRFISIIVWYMITLAFAFERFLSWAFNVNIVTDERVVDSNFPSILYWDVTQAKIDQVQDVNFKVGGFVRSLFNYGDVRIQTAGAIPEICFEAVPHPARVSRVINELKLEEEREKLEGRVS